jgi:hypothetical protein
MKGVLISSNNEQEPKQQDPDRLHSDFHFWPFGARHASNLQCLWNFHNFSSNFALLANQAAGAGVNGQSMCDAVNEFDPFLRRSRFDARVTVG